MWDPQSEFVPVTQKSPGSPLLSVSQEFNAVIYNPTLVCKNAQ